MNSMALEDFIALWNDPDPWSVPAIEWHHRIAGKGVPGGFVYLIDTQMRGIMDDEMRTRVGYVPMDPGVTEEDPIGTLNMKVAQAVRKCRYKSGIGIRALSRGTGISPSSLVRMERGDRRLTFDDVERIARALGLSIASILESARTERIRSRAEEQEDDENEESDR